MAGRRLIDISTLVPNTAYAQVAAIKPAIQGIPEKDWVDDDLNSIQFWHGVSLTDANILTTGAVWLSQLNAENQISSQTAANGLKLAMSLKSMDPSKTAPILSLPPRGVAAAGVVPAAVNMPEPTSFGGTPFAVRAQQVVAGGAAPQVPLVVAAAAAAPAPQVAAPVVPAGEDTESEKRFAYTFLAAYLMKLLVKAPENIVRGIENMRVRYESFYGPSRVITGFVFPLQKAFAYKEALSSQANILTTFTVALAYTQATQSAGHTVKESGVLSYLGYLPFSYTGMHAYTLMVELKNLTNAPMDKLLSLFDADINAPAINKIELILRNYERTTEDPTRSTYFRYCASWGPQYFMSLRSAKCPHLMYTIACAWKTLAAGHENADPENIQAANRLSVPMKRTLKAAGEIIGESLKASMFGGVTASPAYAMALAAPAPAPVISAADWANMI